MNTIRDLLLIQSFDLDGLIEDYRNFFLVLLPSVFMLAVIIEFFDRLEPFTLVKRAFIATLILTSVTGFYKKSIDYSLDSANDVLMNQKQSNILLMDMLGGAKHWDSLKKDNSKSFYRDKSILTGTLSFLKYHLFDSFINDGFTIVIFFVVKLCFLILKVVYSLVYFLGYGLVGIPCLIYLFPLMGNVLRGAILSFLWLLTLPHVLVFILSMIGSEINKGYINGQVIGGSVVGTALLFLLSLFVAFCPIITAMILNGSGVSQAGGIIATLGANYVMSLPKSFVNSSSSLIAGSTLGPKGALVSKMASKVFSGSTKLKRQSKGSQHNGYLREGFKSSSKNQNSKGKEPSYAYDPVENESNPTMRRQSSNRIPERESSRKYTQRSNDSTHSLNQSLRKSSQEKHGKISKSDRNITSSKTSTNHNVNSRRTTTGEHSRRRNSNRIRMQK